MKDVLQIFDRALQRLFPDPFVIAVFISGLTLILATLHQSGGETGGLLPAAQQAILQWGDGFWELSEFTLFMAMILIGGFVVATSPPVTWLIDRLIGPIKTPVQAVLFCTFISMIAAWVNWGFGLVVGGVVALKVGRQLPDVPFRVLVASSYSGFLVWHAGLSGSVPLDMNTEGKLFAQQTGTIVDVSETTFSQFNLILLFSVGAVLPLSNLLHLRLAAGDSASPLADLQPGGDENDDGAGNENFLNRHPSVNWLLFTMGVCFFFAVIFDQKRIWKLDLESINFAFFMIGVVLHQSPKKFIAAVTAAVPKIAPILIQYPLYAAVMAVLRDSSLAEQMADWFVRHSTPETLPLMTFYSAGLLNLFVPSGGGQWAVQAPIVISSAQEMGVDLPRVAMAVAWGDAWTNLAQPFWAIPILAIAGLKVKDILGFCLINLVVTGGLLSLLFLLL